MANAIVMGLYVASAGAAFAALTYLWRSSEHLPPVEAYWRTSDIHSALYFGAASWACMVAGASVAYVARKRTAS